MVNSYSDFDLIGKRFNSSPIVYYYNSFGKAMFDYSNTLNTNDLEILDIFLQGITNGNTFTISDGYYVKDQDGITSNVSGIYQFDGSTGDNFILTTVVTAGNLNTGEYRYERDYFVDPIQFTLNTGFTGDTAYIIKSVTNEGIIEALGLYEDDLIEISYTGITANVDRIRVEKVEKTDEGEELIFLKDPIINDDRIGKYTTINVYVRGDANSEYLEKSKTLNGTARTYSSSGELLDCFEQQNELQAYLRQFGYGRSEVSSVWGYGGNCDGSNTLGTIENNVSIRYDYLMAVKVVRNGFEINGVYRPNLTLLVNKLYCFYQGEITNYNSTKPYQLVFTKIQGNVSQKNLLTGNYISNGIPGYSNGYTILNTGNSIPSFFYYESSNHSGYGGRIDISTSNLTRSNNFI